MDVESMETVSQSGQFTGHTHWSVSLLDRKTNVFSMLIYNNINFTNLKRFFLGLKNHL